MSRRLRRLEVFYLILRADIAVRPLGGSSGPCLPIDLIAGETSYGVRIMLAVFTCSQPAHRRTTISFSPSRPKRSSQSYRRATNFSLACAQMLRLAVRAATPNEWVSATMSLWLAVPAGSRAEARKELIRREGLAWLRRQGLAAGFEFDDRDVRVDGYQPLTIRGGGKNALTLSIIEFDGTLNVRDPNIFLAKVARGFGRGKAFGLGLMLMRRAPA
jgi:CRISPR-associated protein Cas6/Cse3/CasE subtype I-E